MKTNNKTVKETVIENFGSINAFLDAKTKEYYGVSPVSRAYLYKLINHQIPNPGIKTLNILSIMVKMPKNKIYKEYSK
jgi:hypothetical protein